MRIYLGQGFAAEDLLYLFYSNSIWLLYDDINRRIKQSFTHEVMIGFVIKGYGDEVEGTKEVFEQGESRLIVGVYITVPP